MTTGGDRISVDQFIARPPEQVWPFITTPEGLAGHTGFDLARLGDRFALDNMGPGWRDDVLPRLALLAVST